jgi:DNA-binding CsgD family transcriptional regulator/PAS domain-containing protein
MNQAQAKHFADSVDALYQCVTDEGQWPAALQAISRLMDAPGVSVLRTSGPGDGPQDVQAVNRDPETQARYRDTYWRFDPAHAASRKAPVGQWIDCSDQLHPATTEHPEYVRDYALRHGIRWVAGAKVHGDDDGCVVLGLQRGTDGAPFEEGCRDRFAALAPHLKRASVLAAELQGLRNQRSFALAALDELPHAAFVVDAGGRVLQVNRAAESLLAGGQAAPLRSQGGQLELANAAHQTRLASALSQACGKGARKASAFQERAGARGARWVIRVVPLRGLGAAALVYASELPALPPPAQLLQEVLGLTPGEAGVAFLLADGYNVKEVALARGVTEFTVRTQIRALLSKAGARRQSELAQALFAIPGVRSDGVGR